MPECENAIEINGGKSEAKIDSTCIAPLTILTPEQRQNELWQDGRLRIFTDGGVNDPDDLRLSTGECGIFLGQKHPYKTATAAQGKKLDSHRAELQAVRFIMSGTGAWAGVKIWVTFDKETVVNDIKCIDGAFGKES